MIFSHSLLESERREKETPASEPTSGSQEGEKKERDEAEYFALPFFFPFTSHSLFLFRDISQFSLSSLFITWLIVTRNNNNNSNRRKVLVHQRAEWSVVKNFSLLSVRQNHLLSTSPDSHKERGDNNETGGAYKVHK